MDNIISYIFLLSSSPTVYEIAEYVATVIPSLIICVTMTPEPMEIIICNRRCLLWSSYSEYLKFYQTGYCSTLNYPY